MCLGGVTVPSLGRARPLLLSLEVWVAEVHDTVPSFATTAEAGWTDALTTGIRTLTLPGEAGCVVPLHPGRRVPCDSQRPRHPGDVGAERGNLCEAGRGGSDTFSPRRLCTTGNGDPPFLFHWEDFPWPLARAETAVVGHNPDSPKA